LGQSTGSELEAALLFYVWNPINIMQVSKIKFVTKAGNARTVDSNELLTTSTIQR
jgi:hypothetical protein